jgi:hypothetical protein
LIDGKKTEAKISCAILPLRVVRSFFEHGFFLLFRTVLETLFFRRILGSVTVERVIMDMSQVRMYIMDMPQVRKYIMNISKARK